MKNLILSLSIFCSTFVFAQKSQNYVQISYSSICCGTPSTAPVTNYLSQFQKKSKIKTFEILKQSGLGREGEFNLYVGIDQLSKIQKTKFIKGLQEAVSLQNTKRNDGSDGYVNFEPATIVTKKNLASIKNLTIYKNNLSKIK